MKNKTTQGLGNKKYCHFQSMTHSNIEDYKSNVNNLMSIQYVNQSVLINLYFVCYVTRPQN